MRYPVADHTISNPYGQITATYFHSGVDFPGAGIGTPLVACLDFTIHQGPYWSDAGGWSIALRFTDGVLAWYQHMNAKSHLTGGGNEGALVGYMGDTGWQSTGPHLHFETRRADGTSFDPIPWLQQGTAAGGGSTPFPTPTPSSPLEDLTMDECKIIMRGQGDPEWSLVGATVPNGVRTTTRQDTANAWALIYGPAQVVKTRDEYVRAQDEARALASSWLAQQKAIHGT